MPPVWFSSLNILVHAVLHKSAMTQQIFQICATQPLRLRRQIQRQRHLNGCALVDDTFNHDFSAMRLNDSPTNRKPKTHTLRLSRVQRRPKFTQRFLTHSLTSIFEAKQDSFIHHRA